MCITTASSELASSGGRLKMVCRGPGFWWTTVGPCLSEEILLRVLPPTKPFEALSKSFIFIEHQLNTSGKVSFERNKNTSGKAYVTDKIRKMTKLHILK